MILQCVCACVCVCVCVCVLRGFPLRFCNSSGLKKTRMVSLPDRRKVWRTDDISIHLDTIPALDRRTDRQNWQNNITLCMHCMLTCDKKYTKCTSHYIAQPNQILWNFARVQVTDLLVCAKFLITHFRSYRVLPPPKFNYHFLQACCKALTTVYALLCKLWNWFWKLSFSSIFLQVCATYNKKMLTNLASNINFKQLA